MAMCVDRRGVIAGAAGLSLTACARQAPALATQPALEALDLSGLEARHGGRLGLTATQGMRGVTWRGEERFTYCSTFKLFLAAAVLERVNAGQESLEREVPITADDITIYAPVTEPAVGGTLTIEKLCQAAVKISDNPAANILIRELGGLEAFRDWYRSVGDEVTRVDRLEPELNQFAPGDERDTTTPTQAAANVRTVMLSARLDSAQRRRLWAWMNTTPTSPARLKAATPLGWTMGHKTGTSSKGLTNDIGLMWPTVGDPVVVTAYFAAPEATTDQAQRDAVVADAARAALAALEAAAVPA